MVEHEFDHFKKKMTGVKGVGCGEEASGSGRKAKREETREEISVP